VESLNALGEVSELNVHIFSNGGSVFAGNAIYALLKQRKETVNIYVEGIAASIASVIAMAGDNIYIDSSAMLYVHNVMNFMFGLYNKTDMQKLIAELDRVSAVTIRAYMDQTGLTANKINALLDANDGDGTWMNAEQAIELGFCDAMTPAGKATAAMVAMARPGVYRCKGYEIDLTLFKNAPKLPTAAQNGGNKTMAKRMTKAVAAKQAKFRAELISLECPHCGGIMNLDTATGIVSPDPAEDATVAVPLDDTVAKKTKKFHNVLWKIDCPHCGGEIEYETDPDGAVTGGDDGDGFAPGAPLVQAVRNKLGKRAAAKVAVRAVKPKMQTETVSITCTVCSTEFTVDIDPAIEEAVVVCPACQAELTVDTGNVGGDEGNGNDGALPPDEPDIVAQRQGMVGERKRMMELDNIAAAFPQYANAVNGFKQNGTSADCARRWVFQALAAKQQKGGSHAQYQNAARIDANVLRKLGSPAGGNNRDDIIAEKFNSLAKRRGVKTNGQ
jgi:ATP-dependent protease ClpP protease subunit/Zn finger protein HypA/HybF involved in hydrogenase expression